MNNYDFKQAIANNNTQQKTRSAITGSNEHFDQGASATGSTTPNVDSSFGTDNKPLYDAGLQNIFNDYQQNIANLDSKKQEDIQDAYFLREQEKKYLGEYASNNNIGDVSGNILDIYGRYQSNINDINQHYGDLELSFKGEYEAEKDEYQLQVDANNKENLIYEVQHNLTTGLIPGGLSEMEYLESMREFLDTETYWSLMTEYEGIEMNDTINEALSGIFTNFENEDEWKAHVDTLTNLNPKQLEYLKEQYEILGNTTFKPDTEMQGTQEYYTSQNGKHTLTKSDEIITEGNVYDELAALKKDLHTPFAYNGQYFMANADGSFTKMENAVKFTFEPTDIGNEKGKITVNGESYSFDNDTRVGNLKPWFGSNEKAFNEAKGLSKDVIDAMAKQYFNGSVDDVWKNVFKGNPNDKEHTYVVNIKGVYYTVNDGQVYALTK